MSNDIVLICNTLITVKTWIFCALLYLGEKFVGYPVCMSAVTFPEINSVMTHMNTLYIDFLP